ncbi:MAG: DegT/DnrJ/EryC1/StrS family aminotransferase [Gemmatimonadaceae bacterium]
MGPSGLAPPAGVDRDGFWSIDRALHPMTWRWQPPVLSPVSSRSLIDGLGAAIGLLSRDHESAIASLCQRYRATDALLTNSGTSALILALRKAIPRGGTVAFPGYACVDLTTAALGAGVKVRLYDTDPATLSPDLDSVRRVLDRGVDGIVVAHLYGYPADVPGVRALAAESGIPVIEDAAQGAGGTLCGRLLGSLADFSILSFGRGKGMTAGSGGALLVKERELAEWTKRVRAEFGGSSAGVAGVMALAAQSVFARPSMYRLPASVPILKLGEMVYHAPTEPRSITASAVAILNSALRINDREVQSRKARANRLLSRFADSRMVAPVRAIMGGESGFLRLALLDASGQKLPHIAIGAVRGYPSTLEQHPQLQPILASGERAGKGAEFLRDNLFTLPTHSRVTVADIDRLGKWLGSPA